MKFFNLITVLDPTLITGHNIIGFDNTYIYARYRMLVMQSMTRGAKATVSLPNISALKEFPCSAYDIEWNNS